MFAHAIRWAFLGLHLSAFFALTGPAEGQTPAEDGRWAGPWDWTTQVCPEHFDAQADMIDSISHAALVSRGSHAGKVLLWRYEPHDADSPPPGGQPPTYHTTRMWLFNPGNPAVPIKVPTGEFCEQVTGPCGNPGTYTDHCVI